MIIYLAGAETPTNNYGWHPEPKTNVFLSFYHKSTTRCMKKLVRPEPKGLLTIDSGAHSFFAFLGFSAANTKSAVEIPKPEEYFKKYLAWLVEHKDQFDYFVELDIQEIVGLPQVKAWRKEYAQAGLGNRAIWVYHNSDTWREFERIVAECPARYVGSEGVRRGRPLLPFSKMIRYAYEHACRIHGFAMIKKVYLKAFPFYSIDSSSWSMGPRHGVLAHYDQKLQTIRQVPLKGKRMYAELRLPSRLDRSNGASSNPAGGYWYKYAENSYRQLEAHLTEVWKARGIDWDKAMERK